MASTEQTEDVEQLVDNDELGQYVQQHSDTIADRDEVISESHVNPALTKDDILPTAVDDASIPHITGRQTIVDSSVAVDTPTAVNGHTDLQNSGNVQPVFYDNRSGQTVFMQEPVTETRPDGSRVIRTDQIAERWRHYERPLRARQIKLLKVFSAISIVFFFPTGIPALYYAYKTESEFEDGIMRGNIDRAQKFAKRTEHLIIFSGILALVVGVLAFALAERSLMADDTVMNRGIVTGR